MTIASIEAEFVVNTIIEKFVASPKILISIAKALPLLPLKCILYIYHLMQFKNNQAKVQALLNSSSKINVMTLVYIAKLNLKVQPINIIAQKINSFTLKTFGMLLANF